MVLSKSPKPINGTPLNNITEINRRVVTVLEHQIPGEDQQYLNIGTTKLMYRTKGIHNNCGINRTDGTHQHG